MRLLPLVLLAALACRTKDLTVDSTPVAGDDTGEVIDADGDGVPAGEDCDDANPDVSPEAEELCDGVDNNCDGEVDEGVTTTVYTDADADGYGDEASASEACGPDDGQVTQGGDCDDGDAAYNPGAAEDDCADPNDYNCDGSVGYADGDGDGYAACEECDDADPAVNPGAEELCNEVDDDCDSGVDEGVTLTFYADTDGDGFGDVDFPSEACEAPEGYVDGSDDCDDADAAVNPSVSEVCNGLDDDCDALIDDADDGLDASTAATWYSDSDGDGYGDASAATQACDQPSGAVSDSSDCDDGDAVISPAASEVCNSVDDDCNGSVDDTPTDGALYYLDGDCDGYGDPSASLRACDALSGYVSDSSDCDDADARTHPGAEELCNSADSDCDGTADDACETPTEINAPVYAAVDSPSYPGSCARIGEVDSGPDGHNRANLPTFMEALEGNSSTYGLVDAVEQDAFNLDYTIRYLTNYTSASPGYFSPTNPWPTLSGTGVYGVARFRGYLNLGCGDPLNYTIGLIGNDALELDIEGSTVVGVNWSDGQWVKFRYISFPEPGLYSFEVRWSNNLISTIDPFELVWVEGFEPGFDNYDTFCALSNCGDPSTFNTLFTVIDEGVTLQSTDGEQTACLQCSSDADCASSETCNTAGICE